MLNVGRFNWRGVYFARLAARWAEIFAERERGRLVFCWVGGGACLDEDLDLEEEEGRVLDVEVEVDLEVEEVFAEWVLVGEDLLLVEGALRTAIMEGVATGRIYAGRMWTASDQPQGGRGSQ